VLMFTSPGPGDGKTSVTLGVARAFAELGLAVIAIEADLRRPTFARHAEVSSSAGLTGVLAGSPLADELLWLDAATMRAKDVAPGTPGTVGLLPAGELPANPQRVLSDPVVGVIVEMARSMADIVLIDTAPVGTVNDATALARAVEGVVVVARLNHTSKDAARRASRSLGSLGADRLGVVVTDAGSAERHDYYYSSDQKPAAPPVPPAKAPRVRSGARDGAG
jgi:succinoglycan biosynthesis transport protein ExoP